MSQLDFAKIKELAENYRPDMTRFLRDMIRLPSASCQEKAVVERIKEEMDKVGFDKAEIDPMGNVLGTLATSATVHGTKTAGCSRSVRPLGRPRPSSDS